MEQQIKTLIAQVATLNEKYDAIKRLNGENFNIFSILDMERKEVETHSKFIYELLNPNGSHGQGELFLQLFLSSVLNLPGEDVLDVKREDLTRYVGRNRRIDFVIKSEEHQIGIEMKIDAGDQEGQLKDYKEELEERCNSIQKPKLYYLTLTGYEAGEKSTKGKLKVEEDYTLISFETDILNWLEECIEKSATIPSLREGLIHYRNLIKKLTNRLPKEMEEEMERLIRDPKDVEAMQKIAEEYPRLWAKKEKAFWEALREALEERDNLYGFEYLDYYTIWSDEDGKILSEDEVLRRIEENSKKDHHIGFELENKLNDEVAIYLTIRDFQDGVELGVEFYIKQEPIPLKHNELFQICNAAGLKKIWKEKNKWKPSEHNIRFYRKSQKKPSYDLFDDKKFKEYVKGLSDEVIALVEHFRRSEQEIIKIIETEQA